jgi:hypothetical protein
MAFPEGWLSRHGFVDYGFVDYTGAAQVSATVLVESDVLHSDIRLPASLRQYAIGCEGKPSVSPDGTPTPPRPRLVFMSRTNGRIRVKGLGVRDDH